MKTGALYFTRWLTVFLLAIAFIAPQESLAQKKKKTKKIKLKNANTLEFDERIGGMRRLIGNVILEHNKVMMYCDSAYLYEDNTIEAFSNVRIVQRDGVNLYGDRLKYNGNDKNAEVYNNIRLVDEDMVLTTDLLYYNFSDKTASYYGGGKLVNKENTLTSEKGYYFSKSRQFAFKDSVVLVNPEYTMKSDTLLYNKASKVSTFLGPTVIESEESYIYCERGWFDTDKDVSIFKENAYILSGDQQLIGDSIYYDRKEDMGQAYGNVQLIDTTQKITITGDYVQNADHNKRLLVTGNALMIQNFDDDTLFLHADTLRAREEEVPIADTDSVAKHRILFAYNKVKFFKQDMQGKCDSLVYTYRDSMMRLFTEPILWSEENQLTSEFISIKTASGKLEHLEMVNTAFIISEEDSIRFNQIKGKQMKGYFHKNKLSKIYVQGNGQTIYYAEDNGELIGMNRADCSDLLIRLKDNAINQVTFLSQPDATLYPLNEIAPQEAVLKDFHWKIEQRPQNKEDIFVW